MENGAQITVLVYVYNKQIGGTMSWKLMKITELEAMEKVKKCISNLVKTHPSNGDGIRPIGKSFLDSLMWSEIKGKWYIWYNDASNSSGIIYEN